MQFQLPDLTEWYWVVGGDDTRVFSSAASAYVPATDPAYVAWRDQPGIIGPTPIDTEASLAAVLAPYGILVDLTAYAANARWLKEVGGITFGGMEVATDDRSKLLISGARQGADADPTFTTPFATAGTVTTLSATQIIALSNAVLAHVRDCFSTYADVVKGLKNGTIKTPADIDAAFAAVEV